MKKGYKLGIWGPMFNFIDKLINGRYVKVNWLLFAIGGGRGRGAELFPCPYTPKVQARPPRDRDQQPGLGSRGSFAISSKGSFICTNSTDRITHTNALLHQL